MIKIENTIKEVLSELKKISQQIENQKRDNDLLSAKDIAKQYNMSYVHVLDLFKDSHLNIIDDTKTKLVFRCEWERFLKKKYQVTV